MSKWDMRQDWEPVVIRKAPPKESQSKAQVVRATLQSGGKIETEAKYSTGNKQSSAPCYARKLDEDTDNLKHKTVNTDVKVAIAKGRTAKGWKQSDLAQQINERPQIVAEYESGKAIPNQNILQKNGKGTSNQATRQGYWRAAAKTKAQGRIPPSKRREQ
mmetsp:Transcript_59509/g.98038  ORF Transcript_59509/g.98038 Transcript_59509/m.98038 type:complete len:160 (-) Transcript_59509:366-845(-)